MKTETPPSPMRTVVPNIKASEETRQAQANSNPTNMRKSTRYTIGNFLPRTLFIQFSSAVNLFYTFNAVLQSIPSISTNDPLATIIPLTFIICVGILKELLAEIKKWKDDKYINATTYSRLVKMEG